jgi:hypothetical protein
MNAVTVKVFLQDSKTRCYFITPERWGSLAEAYDFRTGAAALATAMRLHLTEAVIYYAFTDPRDDFSMPLSLSAAAFPEADRSRPPDPHSGLSAAGN